MPEAPSRDTSASVPSSPPSKPDSSTDRSGQANSQAGSHPTASPSDRDREPSKDEKPKGKDPGHHLANELKHVSGAGIAAANMLGLGGIVREFQEGIHRTLTIIEGLFSARELYREYSGVNLEEAHQQGAKDGEKQRTEDHGHMVKNDPKEDAEPATKVDDDQQTILDRIAANTDPEHLDRMADKIISGLSSPPPTQEMPEPKEPTKEVPESESIPKAAPIDRAESDSSPEPVTVTIKHPQQPAPTKTEPVAKTTPPNAKLPEIPIPKVEKPLKIDTFEDQGPTTSERLEPETPSDVLRDLLAPFKSVANWFTGKQSDPSKTVAANPSKDFVFPPPVQKDANKDEAKQLPLQITRTVQEVAKDHSEVFGTKKASFQEPNASSSTTLTKTQPPPLPPSATSPSQPPPLPPSATTSIQPTATVSAGETTAATTTAGVAESVVASEAAGTAGAAEAATGLRAAFGALTAGVSATTLVVGGLAVAAAGVIVGLKLIGDAAREEAERLEEYSGEIAKTMAEGEVRRELHKVERGQERGGTLASIVGAQDKLSMAFEKLGESLTDPLIDLLATLVPVIEGIAYGVEKTSEGVTLTYTSVQLAAAYLADWLNLAGNEAAEDAKIRELEHEMSKRWKEFLTDEKKKKLDDALKNDPMLDALNNAWGQPAKIDKVALKQAFEAALDGAGGHH